MAEGTEGDLGSGPQTVGHALRECREALGRTLEDVAAATRIRAAYLAALEAGDYSAFPGEFWARLFLRSYAQQLGLKPDETIVRAFGAGPPPPVPRPERERLDLDEPASTAVPTAVTYQPRAGRRRSRRAQAPPQARAGRGRGRRSAGRLSTARAERRQWTSPVLAVVAAVVVAALLTGIVYNFVHGAGPTNTLSATSGGPHAAGRGPKTPGRAGRPSSGGSGYTTVSLDPNTEQATYRVSEAPIRLNLTFQGRCWIGIQDVAGGAEPVNHVYAPGQVLAFTSAQAVVVDVGSTRYAQGTLNGEPFGPWAIGKPWLLTIEP